MVQRSMRCLALLACACSGAALAAGGHYAVDDATIADPGRCQVEAWHTRIRGGDYAFNVAPACSLGRLELTLEGRSARVDAWERGFLVQGKWLGREVTEAQWGWAFTAGAERDRGQGRVTEHFVNLPVSAPLHGGDTLLRVNAGAARERDTRRTHLTWGVGADRALSERLHVLGEVYGGGDGERAIQLGLRASPVTGEEKHIDLSVGASLRESDDRWLVVGFGVTF